MPVNNWDRCHYCTALHCTARKQFSFLGANKSVLSQAVKNIDRNQTCYHKLPYSFNRIKISQNHTCHHKLVVCKPSATALALNQVTTALALNQVTTASACNDNSRLQPQQPPAILSSHSGSLLASDISTSSSLSAPPLLRAALSLNGCHCL